MAMGTKIRYKVHTHFDAEIFLIGRTLFSEELHLILLRCMSPVIHNLKSLSALKYFVIADFFFYLA